MITTIDFKPRDIVKVEVEDQHSRCVETFGEVIGWVDPWHLEVMPIDELNFDIDDLWAFDPDEDESIIVLARMCRKLRSVIRIEQEPVYTVEYIE